MTLGLQKGYSKEPINQTLVIKFIQIYQGKLVHNTNLF